MLHPLAGVLRALQGIARGRACRGVARVGAPRGCARAGVASYGRVGFQLSVEARGCDHAAPLHVFRAVSMRTASNRAPKGERWIRQALCLCTLPETHASAAVTCWGARVALCTQWKRTRLRRRARRGTRGSTSLARACESATIGPCILRKRGSNPLTRTCWVAALAF